MGKIDYCYHTHTSRCGHAIGKDEEYVLSAINNGIKVLGFSDHVFLPNLPRIYHRGGQIKFDDYLASIRHLKEKYKDQIEIHIGLECEYHPMFKSFFEKILKDGIVEYLILGQHYLIDDKDPTSWKLYNNIYDDHQSAQRYVRETLEAMETGLFIYLAHPDLYVTMFNHWDEKCVEYAHALCKKAKELDMPIELNINGLHWNHDDRLKYSYKEFFKIASSYHNKVIIGYDSHRPTDFNRDETLNTLLEWIDELHLEHITRLNLEK